MDTMVTVDDGLLEDARRLAARRRVTLSALFEEGLREVLARVPTRRTLPTGRLNLPDWLDTTDNAAVRNYLDEVDGLHANSVG